MHSGKKFSSISFFCPAHNEEDNLPVLIPKAHAFFKGLTERFEILIIENGSTDRTAEVADGLARTFPEVRVIHYPVGLGYGGALREGFRNARYDYICYTDADNQYDIGEFAAGFGLMDGADIASGYVRKKAVSAMRRVQSVVWNLMVRIMFFVSIRDINCSMKIYKRACLDAIHIDSVSAFIDAEMLIRAKRAGCVIKQFPVTHFERTSGKAIGSDRSVILATMRDAFVFWFASYKIELAIFAAAFLVRALYILGIQASAGAHGFISHADAYFFYYQAARNLLEHHVLSIAQAAPFYTDAYHTPLYALFVAGLLALKVPLAGVALVQSVLSSLMAVVTYRIGIILSHRMWIGLAAAFLVALEPMSLYWNGLLMSDVLFGFLLTASYSLLMTDRYRMSAMALGLAALTRPIALYLAPLFFITMLYVDFRRGRSLWENIARTLASFAILVAVIFPWFVHNKITSDVWSFTSAGWYEIYVAPLQEFAGRYGYSVPDVAAMKAPGFSRFDFSYASHYRDAALSLIAPHPIQYGITHLSRSIRSMTTNRYEYLVNVVVASQFPGLHERLSGVFSLLLAVGQAFWLLVYFLCAIAFFEKGTRIWWFFFAGLFLVNILLSGGINPGGAEMSRYMLGLHAFFFVFAGIGAELLWRKRNAAHAFYRGTKV